MSLTARITFIVPVLDRQVLEQNLLASPILRGKHGHQLLIQEGFASAAKAYNSGIDRSVNELLVFLHSDIFLPSTWIRQLEGALRYLEQHDPTWGVLGCWGATRTGEYRGHLYSTGWGVLGSEFKRPEPVQTLDEVVLIFRKRSGLSFDEKLPHFHFYGTDICMAASRHGFTSYAISAFCVHNTSQILRLPKEFYSCYSYIRRVWRDSLPIHTSCITVSKYNLEFYRRRLKEGFRQILRLDPATQPREADPARIAQQVGIN